jgi:hypothetical protein
MPLYPLSIRRCQHIKVNGTQCGSPALRDQKHCHFHHLWSEKHLDVNKYAGANHAIALPNLEDANSIQIGLAEVMRMVIHCLIDQRSAALLLHALRTATAWSTVEGREYDEVKKTELTQEDSKPGSKQAAVDPEEAERGRKFMASFKELTDGLERDPKYLDRRLSEFAGQHEGSSPSAGTAAPSTAEGSPRA